MPIHYTVYTCTCTVIICEHNYCGYNIHVHAVFFVPRDYQKIDLIPFAQGIHVCTGTVHGKDTIYMHTGMYMY